MDPQHTFCPNPDCPARGQVGKGNIRIHSRKEQRYRCRLCHQSFSARQGTPLHRRHTPEATISLVMTLVAHGCPILAIVAAFGFQARTVHAWVAAAGQHSQQLHQHLVLQPRDLGQVQADERRAKLQGSVVWLAMALMVSTRLWLGGVVSQKRDQGLIRQLVAQMRACALPRPLLLVTDGLATYGHAWLQAFRSPQHTGRRGRPRLLPWVGVVMVKRYHKRRVVAVERRLVQGSQEELPQRLEATQGGGVLNTAYIERLNATFRARSAALVRRTRGLLRRQARLQAGMYLVGTVYNFCTYHASLLLQDGTRRTPAMAAGITDHRWSVAELLRYRIPPPPWQPPKRRGRRSKALQQLVDQWTT